MEKNTLQFEAVQLIPRGEDSSRRIQIGGVFTAVFVLGQTNGRIGSATLLWILLSFSG